MPRLGEKAPDFEAVTTQGKLKLSDFRGSWLMLFPRSSSRSRL
ncbi:MAG: redoxin domain-containing protein [Hadesarchaea archaeon]|nr:redoxin domain-containing protein [Hadesarchaea archaeon]